MLASQVRGEGRPLVILHGLFGSGDNWKQVAGMLAESAEVHLPDLPDHGDSPAVDELSFPVMADAVADYIRSEGLGSPAVLGHSMGGKVAMVLALTRPDIVSSVIPVDILPREYPPGHLEILEGLSRVEEAAPENRREADEILAEFVPEKPVRAFLLKGLIRTESGMGFRMNVTGIRRAYDRIRSWPSVGGRFEGPALFVYGDESDYVAPHIEAEGGSDGLGNSGVLEFFPNARFLPVRGAGHWLHAERPKEVAGLIQAFLQDNSKDQESH